MHVLHCQTSPHILKPGHFRYMAISTVPLCGLFLRVGILIQVLLK